MKYEKPLLKSLVRPLAAHGNCVSGDSDFPGRCGAGYLGTGGLCQTGAKNFGSSSCGGGGYATPNQGCKAGYVATTACSGGTTYTNCSTGSTPTSTCLSGYKN